MKYTWHRIVGENQSCTVKANCFIFVKVFHVRIKATHVWWRENRERLFCLTGRVSPLPSCLWLITTAGCISLFAFSHVDIFDATILMKCFFMSYIQNLGAKSKSNTHAGYFSILPLNFCQFWQMISTFVVFSGAMIISLFSAWSVSHLPTQLLVVRNLTLITFSPRSDPSSVNQSLWECPPLSFKSPGQYSWPK